MKNVQGLVIALALGFVGALCNWLYLARSSGETKKMAFIKVAPGAKVSIGHRFKAEDLQKLEIPATAVGTLKDVAPPWDHRNFVIGRRATRAYKDNQVILNDDLKTPGIKSIAELLGPDEKARTVPVDSRSFVPERLNPGDQVTFEVPKLLPKKGSPGDIQVEEFGPFRVLAVGNRTGTADVARASRAGLGPQNVITIRVGASESKRASELARGIEAVSGKGVQVIVHSAKAAGG